jgi:hypothetical protein
MPKKSDPPMWQKMGWAKPGRPKVTKKVAKKATKKATKKVTKKVDLSERVSRRPSVVVKKKRSVGRPKENRFEALAGTINFAPASVAQPDIGLVRSTFPVGSLHTIVASWGTAELMQEVLTIRAVLDGADAVGTFAGNTFVVCERRGGLFVISAGLLLAVSERRTDLEKLLGVAVETAPLGKGYVDLDISDDDVDALAEVDPPREPFAFTPETTTSKEVQ